MKRLLLAAAAVAAIALSGMVSAKADFIFQGEVNTKALGFGDVHRLQEVQLPTNQSGVEVGTVSPTPVTIEPTICTGQANCGADKSSTPTITSIGWTTGSTVSLGVDISQTGSTSDGLNLNSFGINIYDPTGTTIIHTFSLGSPFLITAEMGHGGPGNGTDVFTFVLDSAQQALWDSFHFNSSDVVGSFLNWGCSNAVSTTCQPANDGPDSLLAFQAVPGPIAGAGIPGLIAALGGMFGLNRFRRKRRVQA
jgi:hypothetical protein